MHEEALLLLKEQNLGPPTNLFQQFAPKKQINRLASKTFTLVKQSKIKKHKPYKKTRNQSYVEYTSTVDRQKKKKKLFLWLCLS